MARRPRLPFWSAPALRRFVLSRPVHRRTLTAWAVVAVALSGSPRLPAETDIRRDVVVEVVERVMPSVVNIKTDEIVQYRDPFADLFREFWGPYYRNRPPTTRYSLGSGVIIDEEGYVLTNLHVVQRASKVWVQLHDGREFEAEPIVGTSRRDVALLRLRAPKEERFRAVRFASEEDLLLGETVLALGNPFGLGGSVSRGILSSKNRRPPLEQEPLEIQDWLQTDAAINPGSSGGPLLNLHGELIGLNVAVYREGQGIGFAIPVKQVTEALSGIFTPEVQESLWYGMKLRSGRPPLGVLTIDPDSPAAQAGLRVGDEILEINGQKPRSFIHGTLLLNQAPREARLVLNRGGSRKPVTVTVKPRSLQDLIQQRLGATLQEMDADVAAQFGLRPGQGLLIASVEKSGPADQARLETGHILAAMDGQTTPDLLSAAGILAAKKKDDPVELTLGVQQRRGPYAQLRQIRVTLKVR